MERKPIKRNKYIIRLSKDHHLTLLFCWKIRTGLKREIETNRIKNYIHYFWQTHLLQHFNEEETILFAGVKDTAVQKAIDEHVDIRRQVNAIVNSENIQASALKTFADTVDSHVRYEERELFPHLEKVLSETQLQQKGNALEQTHAEVCKDDFSDEFWTE